MAVSIPDKEAQKVKLVGGLWTFKLVLSILRDLLLIIFVLVAIGVLVYVASSISQLASGFGGVAGLSSLVAGSANNGGLEQTLQAQLQQFQQDVDSGNWNGASSKISGFELIANQANAPTEMKMMISELKSAVKAKDKAKVNQLLGQFDGQNR